MQTDREIVMAAINNDGWALQYASEELRADRELVLVAVKLVKYYYDYSTFLRKLPENFQNDPEIILALFSSTKIMELPEDTGPVLKRRILSSVSSVLMPAEQPWMGVDPDGVPWLPMLLSFTEGWLSDLRERENILLEYFREGVGQQLVDYYGTRAEMLLVQEAIDCEPIVQALITNWQRCEYGDDWLWGLRYIRWHQAR